MKKNKKLSLQDLKVKSFVTDIDKSTTEKLVGGAATVANINCAQTIADPYGCLSAQAYSACNTCGIACTYNC